MKKTLFAVSTALLFASCSSSDAIYSQDENTSTMETLLPNLKSNEKINKTSLENIIMNLPFPSGVQGSNGGCSFGQLDTNGNSYTSTAAFGPNPISYYDYLIRGYGKPRKYLTWNGVRLQAQNRSKTTISTRGGEYINNDPISNAISIQQSFQPNFTYEVILTTYIEDDIYVSKNDSYTHNDNTYNINKSEAFPTIAVQLKDSPEIPGADPCADRPNVGNGLVSANYYKKEKAELTNLFRQQKTFVFNFSTTENKNAILIYFWPELSDLIPKSAFTMYITNIKIVQKPFDPSHVVPPFRDTSNPCGFRGGC